MGVTAYSAIAFICVIAHVLSTSVESRPNNDVIGQPSFDEEALIQLALRKQSLEGSVCGGVLNSSAGIINYKFEEEYEENERCVWIIHTLYEEINIHLIAEGFDSTGQITVYRVESDGSFVTLREYTESQPSIDSFPGPLLVLVFSTSESAFIQPTSTTLPYSTPEGYSTINTEPTWWWDTTTDSWRTTSNTDYPPTSTLEPTTERGPRGKGFMLSFNGVTDYPETPSTTYKLFYFDTPLGQFSYPSQGLGYSEDEVLFIIINPVVAGLRLSLTVRDVRIPSPEGENYCGLDTLQVLGPFAGKFETRLRYCTEDPLSLATISSTSQFLVVFNAVNETLSGRGGFNIAWVNQS